MRPDPLSVVLRAVRLRGAVFFTVSCSGAWATEAPAAKEIAPLLMPGTEHVIEYHAVAHGHCWAAIPGGPSVRLGAGDAVVFPQGDAHVVSSAAGLRGIADFSWFPGAQSTRLPLRIAYNGANVQLAALDHADALLVCGFLGCDLLPFNPLMAALPRLLHLRADRDNAWMADFTRQAVVESQGHRPGGEAMLARMSEMLFVDAVRRYANELSPQAQGWLAGLRDRFVGRALALMHDRPAEHWTLDTLGQAVGLSRSALHERFCAKVGVPPMHYLMQWRMQSAARLLLETQDTVASIAVDVGYDSEAAFARAFKRTVGQPPATWRRERDNGAGP